MQCQASLSNVKAHVICSKTALWEYQIAMNIFVRVCGIHARAADRRGKLCTAIGAPKMTYAMRKEAVQ